MKIGIYGLGRFGSFWARLMAREFDVIAYNRTQRDFDLPGITLCTLEELCSADVIFLCVAISSVEGVLKKIAPMLKAGTLVMDTCSVKVFPAQKMLEILPEGVSCIATHPMFGPDSGRNGVVSLPMVYSPLRCDEERAAYWLSVFRDTYRMLVHEMTPEEHDREAAFTQGVTHFIGRVLGGLELSPSEIGTAGYRSLLTIIEQTCNDPMQLFFDLQRYNPYTHDMHLKLNESLREVLAKLNEAESGE